MNVSRIPSEPLEDVLLRARARAVGRHQSLCDCEQVLEVLLEDAGESAALVPITRYLDLRPRLPFRPPDTDLSRMLRVRALGAARDLARDEGRDVVQPGDLLAALLAPTSPVVDSLRDEIVHALRKKTAPANGNALTSRVPADGLNKVGGAKPRYLMPLVPAPEDDHLVDRPDLVDRLLQVLMFGSPLVVGPPGSGRRSLVHLALRRLAGRDVPRSLAHARVFELDPVRLIAGTTYRGELEERVQQALEELSAGDLAIVMVENLHLLVGSAGGGGDIASAFVPRLKAGTLRIVGCTTQDELREKLEKSAGLLDQLTVVPVPSAEAAEARHLLEGTPHRIREAFEVEVTAAALDLAVQSCLDHLPHLALPGAAARLLHGAASRLAYETGMLEHDGERANSRFWRTVGQPKDGATPEVGRRHVLLAVSQLHRVPFDHLESGVEQKVRGLDAAFAEHIFGQDQVLNVLSRTVKVALLNLSDPRRPRGRLFFLGPPGTGKTESARLLARYLMGSESALLRFDMSEFQEASSVSTLLGSDKGLVGSDEGGRLTEPLRENPHRVILFDEIEKAHPSVYNLFLQILDNGEIHDKRNCKVSFRHALLIFTSNAGCDADRGMIGASRAQIVERLRTVFRPEFLDRIEEFVPFAGLDHEARRRVAAFQLERLAELVRRTYHQELSWDDAVEMAAARTENEAGARGILRWVQGEAKPAVAEALLASRAEGGARIVLRVAACGCLVAEVEPAMTAAI